MLQRLFAFLERLRPPGFTSDDPRARVADMAQFVNLLIWLSSCLSSALDFVAALGMPSGAHRDEVLGVSVFIVGATSIFCFAIYRILRSGRVQLGAGILLGFACVVITGLLFLAGPDSMLLVSAAMIIVLAAVLFGPRTCFGVAVYFAVVSAVLHFGGLTFDLPGLTTPESRVSSVATSLIGCAIILIVVAHSQDDALGRARSRAKEVQVANMHLADANLQLLEANEHLEARVKERTKDLQVAVDVSAGLQAAAKKTDDLLRNAEWWLSSVTNAEVHVVRVRSDQGVLALDIPANTEIAPILRQRAEAVMRGESDTAPESLDIVKPLLMGHKIMGVLIALQGAPRRMVFDAVSGSLAAGLDNARLLDELETTLKVAKKRDHQRAEFFASMTHEMRTPVNTIMLTVGGHVYLQEMGMPLDMDVVTADFEVITRNSKHLLTLIGEILDFSKIEAGQLKLMLNEFDPITLITDIADDIRPQAQAKNLQVFVEVGPDVPTAAKADPTRIRQILLNLGSNAVKYTEFGHVTLNLTLVPPVTDSEQPRLRFSVTDTGNGIPKDKQDGVFIAYQQLENDEGKAGSTGLGLPIALELARLHGGNLTLASDGVAGMGSTFALELPVTCELAAEAQLKLRTVSAAFAPISVLLVEDQAAQWEIVQRVFPRDRYQLHWAKNLYEALPMALQLRPDLIVVDVFLPNGDAIALQLALQTHHELQKIPVANMAVRNFTEEDITRIERRLNFDRKGGTRVTIGEQMAAFTAQASEK